MGIKKQEMIDTLVKWGIDPEGLDYNQIRKTYTKTKTIIAENAEVNNEGTKVESVIEKEDQLSIRDRLIVEIVEFMDTIKDKIRGTDAEVKLMFNLYNNFYKRNESPGCSVCVGNVYKKMMNIYKKYKK